uniref:UmuC domain-containing protein n=1 Tax=Globodera pallida TaxID=36090 RepID=A0A183CF46_GLOPA
MDEFRVVALIDMDSFYAQVEERERPECRGKPLAVVQITANGQSGQAIAVNYAARAFGVQRGMGTAEVMRRICPIIHLCRVPPIDGLQEKGDLGKYRSASEEVFEVLAGFSQNIIVEKASIDEAYLDLTESCKNELANETSEDFVRKMVSETDKLYNKFLNSCDKLFYIYKHLITCGNFRSGSVTYEQVATGKKHEFRALE